MLTLFCNWLIIGAPARPHQWGRTSLLQAARGGHLEVVIKLAEMGVDPAAVERVSSFCCSLSPRKHTSDSHVYELAHC